MSEFLTGVSFSAGVVAFLASHGPIRTDDITSIDLPDANGTNLGSGCGGCEELS